MAALDTDGAGVAGRGHRVFASRSTRRASWGLCPRHLVFLPFDHFEGHSPISHFSFEIFYVLVPRRGLANAEPRLQTEHGHFIVCRHRAACVAPEAEGQATRFRCRYHGWTYDLAGRLRGTPEFDGVADTGATGDAAAVSRGAATGTAGATGATGDVTSAGSSVRMSAGRDFAWRIVSAGSGTAVLASVTEASSSGSVFKPGGAMTSGG